MSILHHLLVYFALLSILIYVSLLVKPRTWLHRMPPAVRAKVPGKTQQEKKWFIVMGIPMGLVFVLYPMVVTAVMYNRLDQIMLSLFAFTAGFAIWDTLVLDLLIFCGITPKPMIIEGTTKQDYKDTMYHLKAGAKGLVMAFIFSVIGSFIIAAYKNPNLCIGL